MITLQKQAGAFGKTQIERLKGAPMKASPPSTSQTLEAIDKALSEPEQHRDAALAAASELTQAVADYQKRRSEEMVAVCPCGYRSCSRARGSEGRIVPRSQALD